MISLPIYLQIVLEYSAMGAGLSIAPLSLSMFAVPLVAGKRAGKRRPASLIRAGFALFTIGMVQPTGANQLSGNPVRRQPLLLGRPGPPSARLSQHYRPTDCQRRLSLAHLCIKTERGVLCVGRARLYGRARLLAAHGGQASLPIRAGIADQPGRGEKPMLMHPYVAGQLAREHSRQMRADASQRQLRHQQGHREARKANAEAVSGTRSVTALVTSARNGDKQAWDELFERYAPLIWSICRRYRLSQMDADDVGQNVWLQLVGQLAAIREPAALPGWLATTTRRECCRVLRRTRQQPAPDHWPDDAVIADTMTGTVESELLRTERSAALREALTQLPPDSRRLIALLIQDPPVPYAEISVKLGIPVGSIGPHRARCLQKLRRHPAIVALINAEAQTA